MLVLLIIAVVIIVDQIMKMQVLSSMELGMSIQVWPGIFHITYIQNAGAAFGILAEQRWIFIAVSVLLLAAAAFFYPQLRRESAWIRYGAALLVGGAIGNLIDRIWLGQVIDFLDFRVWPVFNIADIGIVVGVGCIMYAMLWKDRKETES